MTKDRTVFLIRDHIWQHIQYSVPKSLWTLGEERKKVCFIEIFHVRFLVVFPSFKRSCHLHCYHHIHFLLMLFISFCPSFCKFPHISLNSSFSSFLAAKKKKKISIAFIYPSFLAIRGKHNNYCCPAMRRIAFWVSEISVDGGRAFERGCLAICQGVCRKDCSIREEVLYWQASCPLDISCFPGLFSSFL